MPIAVPPWQRGEEDCQHGLGLWDQGIKVKRAPRVNMISQLFTRGLTSP